MKITDLTRFYIKDVLGNDDPGAYFKSAPVLFKHYFSYWANKKRFYPTLQKNEIAGRLALVKTSIKRIQKRMVDNAINHKNIEIILFVGQNVSNGHAFRSKNHFIVWIPIEAYRTEQQADVFIAHEILHAVHYSNRPEFFFNSIEKKENTGRQIMTEGIATLGAQTLFNLNDGEALWADYLEPKKIDVWLKSCSINRTKLFSVSQKKWNSRAADLFQANNPDDVTKYRGGYFVGLRLLQSIALTNELSLPELLSLSKKDLEAKCLKAMKIKNNY